MKYLLLCGLIFHSVGEIRGDTKFFGSGLTYFGTKWCGLGDNALSDDDLGEEYYTDKCCQEHDLCDDLIEDGQTKYGLRNDFGRISLHCNCDRKFMKCLYLNLKEKRNTTSSQVVGELFFNFMDSLKCFKKYYPIVGCNEYMQVDGMERCVDYIVDKNKPKEWQFFDDPFFTSPDDDYWTFFL